MHRKSIILMAAASLAATVAVPQAFAACGIGYVNGIAQQVCYDDGIDWFGAPEGHNGSDGGGGGYSGGAGAPEMFGFRSPVTLGCV